MSNMTHHLNNINSVCNGNNQDDKGNDNTMMMMMMMSNSRAALIDKLYGAA